MEKEDPFLDLGYTDPDAEMQRRIDNSKKPRKPLTHAQQNHRAKRLDAEAQRSVFPTAEDLERLTPEQRATNAARWRALREGQDPLLIGETVEIEPVQMSLLIDQEEPYTDGR